MNKIARPLALAVSGLAALGIVTACAGSSGPAREGPATQTAPGGSAAMDAAGPAPEFGPPQAPPTVEKRDVVRTAAMTVMVADPSKAADEAAVIAERAQGRVDSRTEDAGSGSGRASTTVTLRVPVAELDVTVRELKTLGTVETASTTAEDVTAQRVDLDARIEALQVSVDRLLAIMRDARDPEALIAAEEALSQRQADLDSLRAQRDALGDRISYSTVDVAFFAEQVGGPAPKKYEGFFGQVQRGWDGLVAVVSGAVLLFGFLLPWLGVLAVVGVVIYGLIRWSRARTAPPPLAPDLTPPDEPAPPPSAEPASPRR